MSRRFAYYATLGCGRNSTQTQIAQAFRVLALTHHPDKNKDNGQLALSTFIFSEICEAYEVLSTPELKEIYDQYGLDLLKNGVPAKKVGFKGGYQFQGNSLEIFERFFGTTNPFSIALDESGDQVGTIKAKGAGMMGAFSKKFQDLTVTVKCTLEEFYYGCRKEVNFERMIVLGDGTTQKMTIGTKIIQVKPGMASGTTLEFQGEGHQRPNKNQSDLIIVMDQIPHPVFKRMGDNLILEHKISLMDSLNAGPIHFKTIEGEQKEITIAQVINPDSAEVIPLHGMPVLNNDPLGPIKRNYARGNLILRFDIEFPQSLNDEKKAALCAVLDEACGF